MHLLSEPIQILLVTVFGARPYPPTAPFQAVGIVLNCATLFFCALLLKSSVCLYAWSSADGASPSGLRLAANSVCLSVGARFSNRARGFQRTPPNCRIFSGVEIRTDEGWRVHSKEFDRHDQLRRQPAAILHLLGCQAVAPATFARCGKITKCAVGDRQRAKFERSIRREAGARPLRIRPRGTASSAPTTPRKRREKFPLFCNQSSTLALFRAPMAR